MLDTLAQYSFDVFRLEALHPMRRSAKLVLVSTACAFPTGQRVDEKSLAFLGMQSRRVNPLSQTASMGT